MTTWGATVPLPRCEDEADLLQRLERFRLAHGDVMVLRSAPHGPVAWIGRAKISAPTLAELLDALEQIFGAIKHRCG